MRQQFNSSSMKMQWFQVIYAKVFSQSEPRSTLTRIALAQYPNPTIMAQVYLYALRWWEVSAPDISTLLNEYETIHGIYGIDNVAEKHYKDYPAFQSMFYEDFGKLFKSFDEISNPFVEEELKCLHNGQLMNSDVQDCLANMLDVNEKKYDDFLLHRMEIRNNVLHLPSVLSADKKKINRVQKKKIELKTVKQLQAALVHREDLVKECFQHDVTEYPSSLTDGCDMYHSSKSELLKRYKWCSSRK